jgi:hypothetical protein
VRQLVLEVPDPPQQVLMQGKTATCDPKNGTDLSDS